MKTVLAADIGGTKTSTAWVDERGAATRFHKRPSGGTVAETISAIRKAVLEGERPPAAIGVIVPGIYDPESGKAWCPNLWGGEEVALGAALAESLGVKVVVESDRTGYVLGESWLGAARGLNDAVFVSIGTGIGAGILAGGRVVQGAHGIAGSAGWMSLGGEWSERFARCGNWEAESAGPAVAAAYGARRAEEVVAAAKYGDARAAEVLRRAARFTGRGVANLISVLNPEMVVMGGGLIADAAEFMMDVIREEAARWAQPLSARRCRIEMTQLGENAGLLGAARLAHGEI